MQSSTATGSSSPETAGSQLVRYLHYFRHFNTTTHALSVEPALEIEKFSDLETSPPYPTTGKAVTQLIRMAERYPEQPYLLCLQDPGDYFNDIGSRCHAIKHISRTIVHLDERLRDMMQRYDQARREGHAVQDGSFSLLLSVVGRCHEVYASRRAKMAEFATLLHREGKDPKVKARPNNQAAVKQARTGNEGKHRRASRRKESGQ
jgi:hypothetical protein